MTRNCALAAGVMAASLAFGQAGGTIPKPKPDDYEVHANGKTVAIGAEYMVHAFSGQGQTFFVKNYLVVEVALYPLEGEMVSVNEGEFLLRVNGSRKTIQPSPVSMVASSLQRPDWDDGPRLEGSVGTGATDVIFGRPRATQVPGGQTPRGPRPSPVPAPEPPGGIQPERHLRADELAVQTALPEGTHHGPISGFLYFAYKGKAEKIKSVELLYDDAALTLR